MPRPVILDCDTGTDDAIAIMLAALHPDLELLGVSTVFGNHPVALTTDNTLRVLDHLGRRGIGVYAGADAAYAPRLAPPDPRVLPPHLPLPEPISRARETPAAEWLATAPEGVTLVATGPLTNLANALDLAPGLVERVAEVVLLGCSDQVPSVTPLAERNVWNDPAAADRVLRARWRKLTVVPLDVTYLAQVTVETAHRLAATGTPAGTVAAELMHERIELYAPDRDAGDEPKAPVHDPLAVALLIDSGVARLTRADVRIDLAAGPAYGRSEISLDPAGRVWLAVDADAQRYADLLVRTLS